MARSTKLLFVLLNGLVLTAAIPQYGGAGGSYGGAAAAAPPPPPAAGGGSYGGGAAAAAPPPPPAAGGGSYGGGAAAAAPTPPPPPPPAPAPAPAPAAYGGGGAAPAPPPAAAGGSYGGAGGSSSSGGSSGGSGGGDLTVQCKATPDAGGKFKYDCSGVNKDAITLKTEHFLWLENQAGSSQNLDIEIPNYNIDEFIRAAYKALGPQDGAKINILLKKPDVTYNAAKDDAPAPQVGAPSVSVNYQPVDKVSVHYPTQKQYTSGGPNPPPPGGAGPAAPAPGPSAAAASSGGGGAYSRPQRESGYRYYFVRQ